MKSMKVYGFAIDIAMVALTVYVLAQYPIVGDIKQRGLGAVVADLPTPIPPTNATGVLVALNEQFEVTSPATALRAQEWYNFVLGDDGGTRAAGNPSAAYFHEMGAWLNALVLPEVIVGGLPHALSTWMRNMAAGMALYLVAGCAWAWYIYRYKADVYFPNRDDIPAAEELKLQISVSMSAMVFYSLAPTIGEWLMEHNCTFVYAWPAEVGGVLPYLALCAAYLLYVEWGIYWCHRSLHEPHLYKLLHRPHHIYSNRNQLSPFAGLAFHPIDGLIQASPYTFGMFILPVHFWTHLAMLFFTALWTTNIHDTLTGDTEPVMGSAYHTIHHTAYVNNYGQIFVLFDWLHDTLQPPKHRKIEWGWEARTPGAVGKAHEYQQAIASVASEVDAKKKA